MKKRYPQHGWWALVRAYLLMWSMKKMWLVRPFIKGLLFLLKRGWPLNFLLKYTVYKQFVGGEHLANSKTSLQQLNRFGVKSILDFAAEGQDTAQGVEYALQETLSAITYAATNDSLPFVVFKPTALVKNNLLEKYGTGQQFSAQEQQEFNAFENRIEQICSRAKAKGISVLIDAEDYAYQLAVDTVAERMMHAYNRDEVCVFNTFQMYRVDRLAFLQAQHKKAVQGNYHLGAKIVRGAYLTQERKRAANLGYLSPVHDTKAGTDKAFNAAVDYVLQHIDCIAVFCGTHNEESIRLMQYKMQLLGIENGDKRCWFSQLYGMADHISFPLASQAYNVAKYVPYGKVLQTLPYLLRRIEENSAVSEQATKELSLMKNEIQQRCHLR